MTNSPEDVSKPVEQEVPALDLVLPEKLLKQDGAGKQEHSKITEEEYKKFAVDVLQFDELDKVKRNYEVNVVAAKDIILNHPFFMKLQPFLKEKSDLHAEATGSPLIIDQSSFCLETKSFDSLFNKTYRHNVIHNKNFPGPPNNGWITEKNWYGIVDDIIRSTLVCKFFDGPAKLAEELEAYANSLSLKSSYKAQQKDVGYYAYHYYVQFNLSLVNINFEPIEVHLPVEIQLTTQLQEILYKITHKFYEFERSTTPADPSFWKWDRNSSKFKAGYISHTLHLLESIIVQLRDDSQVHESKVI